MNPLPNAVIDVRAACERDVGPETAVGMHDPGMGPVILGPGDDVSAIGQAA